MDAKTAERELASIALDQGGYFTAKQALSVGYSYQNQRYHASNGDWIKVARGIYRLHDFPALPQEELIVLTLMSSNRTGEPQAVVSHETALAIHEISDANPAKIHMTVPPDFHKPMPASVVLHHASLHADDWEDRQGYRVTTVLRTILDIAADPVSWPFLEGAIRDALNEGSVRRKQVLAADGTEEIRTRLRSALKSAEHAADTGVPNTITRTASQDVFTVTGLPPSGVQAVSSSPSAPDEGE